MQQCKFCSLLRVNLSWINRILENNLTMGPIARKIYCYCLICKKSHTENVCITYNTHKKYSAIAQTQSEESLFTQRLTPFVK